MTTWPFSSQRCPVEASVWTLRTPPAVANLMAEIASSSSVSLPLSVVDRLPPELWIGIFSLAVSIPGELNTAASTIFDRPGNPEVALLRTQLVPTSLAILSTSKLFYTLSVSLLYRAILLKSSKSVHLLLRTLNASNALAQRGGRVPTQHQDDPAVAVTAELGQRTKRLDVRVKSGDAWKEHGALIVKLFPLLPNLTHLVGCGNWKELEPTLFIQPLTQLRHLQLLFVPIFVPDSKYLTLCRQIVEALPSLSVIVFSLNRNHKLYPLLPAPYTNLRILGSADGGLYHDPCQPAKQLPNLRALHLCHPNRLDFDPSFMSAHGAKITTIDMEECPLKELITCAPWFPNLTQLIIDISFNTIDAIREVVNHQSKIRSVRRVGLTVLRRQFPIRLYKDAYATFLSLFPNLEGIRFMERRVVDLLMTQSVQKVRMWHQDLLTKRVHLEREDGVCILRGFDSPCECVSRKSVDLVQGMAEMAIHR